MEMSRSWQELGVVDTIYEDDHEAEEEECFDSTTMSSSPAASSRSCSPPAVAAGARPAMPPVLRNAAREWSRANRSSKPDVIVRVQEHCFPLHRDPITSESSYLKRCLLESSDIAVDLPAGLTVDAFADAVASCYGAEVALSPANLAAAWAAAHWLELCAEDGLARRAEDYFFQEVATDHGRAAAVLRSCTAFLGGEAAGAGAALLVRCLETLAASGGAGGRWLEDVAALSVEEFEVIVEAMRARFEHEHDHDLMYTIVDHYLENHRGKLTEEEKSRVCYNVNCTKLSHHLFMHLVQNPRLPLRFVVQAMLVEQLHSHHSMLLSGHHHAAAAIAPTPSSAAPPALLKSSRSGAFSGAGDAASSMMTLGDILQRDAVLRQSAHIRASMQATSHRIDTLERELAGLRTRLRRSEQAAAEAAAARASATIDRASAKSASFRIPRSRLWDGEDVAATSGAAAVKESTNAKGLKTRLVLGFKNLFGRRPVTACAASPAPGELTTARVSRQGVSGHASELEADADSGELVYKERMRPHRRNLSVA